MPGRSYQTLALELFECADRVADELERRGYQIRVEHTDLGCPFVPTLFCSRGSTTLMVEVTSQISQDRLSDLTRYGKSCGRDTRVALCLPSSSTVAAAEQAKLQAQGIGLFFASAAEILQPLQPQDLALNLLLPERGSLSPTVRAVLGPAYDHFEQGTWREGFDEACQAFEVEARRYLKKWTKTNRVLITTNKGPTKLALKTIDKLTMGALARTFGKIQIQTALDVQIWKTLKAINTDRVAAAHHKAKKTSETRLRKNVGRDMWAIIKALKDMLQ